MVVCIGKTRRLMQMLGWGMSEDTFQVLFSLPHHYSYKRNPAGGARLTIDIGRESVKEVERLLDLAEISDGLILAGAWVVVEQGGKTVRKAKPPVEDESEADDTW
jgi:hypothetical protein